MARWESTAATSVVVSRRSAMSSPLPSSSRTSAALICAVSVTQGSRRSGRASNNQANDVGTVQTHGSDPRLALHASVVKRSRNSCRIAADQPCVPHPQVPPVLGTAPQRPTGRQSECKQGTPTTGSRRGRRSRCRRSCGCCFLVDVRLQPRDLGLNACLAMSSFLVRPWSNVDSFNTTTTTLTCPLCRVALH